MKETTKTSRVVGLLEKMYRQLNDDKFDSQLDMPVITIQSTPRSYGHVTCAKVWRVKGANSYELNIAAGSLDRPIENVVATLLHEMVHIYHLCNGIQDTSRGNTYHNKAFRDKAVSVGLQIEHDKKIGWTDIKMSRKDSMRVSVGTGSSAVDGSKSPKKPSSTRKYLCPVCGCTYRATKDIRAICGECYYNTGKIVDMLKS